MKRYFTTIFQLAIVLFKHFSRDPVALFFTFLFPLLFLFVFGSLFKSSDVSFDVVLLNRSDTAFAKQFSGQLEKSKVFKVKDDIKSLDTAKQKMGRGEIDSIIELPKDFGAPNKQGLPSGGVVVYFDQGNPQTGQTVGSVMQGVLDGINKKLTGNIDPLVITPKPTNTANLSSIDYLLSGLLGFTILSLGIFGLANGFPADKKRGVLRRLHATPLKASQLVLGTLLQYMLIGVMSLALMYVVGIVVFGFEMRGDYLTFLVFSLLGIVVMFGFGLAIGGWARNENQAALLSNIVAFPLMFLSGAFFPRFLMPEWLQSVTAYLPLTPIIDGLRYILTEGKTLWQLGPELALMGAWGVIIYIVAFRFFRWE
jgi:ABC-2 type transport system permease protein